MSSILKKIIVENFANIAIALSILFLILELNQNRKMMERELLFMEAQAFQARADISMEFNLSLASDRELVELMERAEKKGLEGLSLIEKRTPFDVYHARKIVIENTYFQAELGLVEQDFWDSVGVSAVRRSGPMFLRLGVPMSPSFEVEVRRVVGLKI